IDCQRSNSNAKTQRVHWKLLPQFIRPFIVNSTLPVERCFVQVIAWPVRRGRPSFQQAGTSTSMVLYTVRITLNPTVVYKHIASTYRAVTSRFANNNPPRLNPSSASHKSNLPSPWPRHCGSTPIFCIDPL